MPSPSHFQTLPTLVVDIIIEYLEGHPRTTLTKLIEAVDCENRSYLIPFTTVSKVWRLAALSLLFETCAIRDADSKYGFKIEFPAFWCRSPQLLLHNSRFVKRVVSTVHCFSIGYKKVTEVCARPGCEDLSFPFATTLKLALRNLGDYSGVRRFRFGTRLPSSSADFGLDALAGLVHSHFRLVPAAVNIGVSVTSENYPGSGAEHLCDKITYMLCNGRVRSLGVSSWRDGRPVSLGLQSESELTMIMSGPNDECASFAMLAYLNSRTLTAIHAKIQHVHDWLDLICGNANTPVAFTSLKTLSLNIANVDYSDEWAGIEGVIMFPNLSTLEVTGAYPFADDMLFRGNGSTIRYLHLPFKTIAANVLEKVGILGCTGVAQMKQIRFGDSTEADKEVIARNGWEHITRQLPLILNMTTSLQLSGDGPTYEVYKSMVTMRVETSIQHLDVRNLVYRHDHVIRVIGALPNLVSFTAEVAHIESRGDVPERYKSPSDLYKRYYPVGSNFRVLCVPLMTEFSGCQIAEEVVRIAIVCQNLVQVHVPPHDRSMFKRAVSWAIDSSEFAPYADSLRHLL